VDKYHHKFIDTKIANTIKTNITKMKLTIKLEKTNTCKKIVFSKKTVAELLLQLKINPQTVLIVRNNQVITEDEKLKNGDSLELLSVVSGG